MTRTTCDGQDGVSLIEVTGVLALLGLAMTVGAFYVSSMDTPIQTGGQLLEGLLIQARARSISTTTAHRVQPGAAGRLVVETATNCSAGSWTAQPTMDVDLPTGVSISPTTWSVCFSRRGSAFANVVVTLAHAELETRQLEVLQGGVVRWLD
ncbi:MAG: hypothetical protein GY716_08390 [bacterium]|nr:hypothetical protein [bacterium]